MNKDEYFNNLLKNAEIKLTMAMIRDIGDFEYVQNKVAKLEFLEPTCKKMYEIMQNMYNKLGYNVIDTISITGYCDRMQYSENQKKEILSTYSTITNYFSVNTKIDFDGVFEEYSMISSTVKFRNWVITCGGIDEVANKLLKLENMEQVNAVIEGRLIDFFNTGTAEAGIVDTSISDLIDDKYINSIINREDIIDSVPFLPQFPILNKILKGNVRGSTGFAMHSGKGKTSAMISIFVMSMLENSKDKINIYANEQTAKVFMNMLFFSFLSQVFNMRQSEFNNVGNIYLSRDKFISGNFSDEEIQKFIFIVKLFKKRYRNRITHTYFEDMTPNSLRKDIRKKYKTGHRFMYFDTMKDPDEDYKKLMKLVTTFDQQTKKYNIMAYNSLQLSDESLGVKYLTNKCLASAKGTKRVFENLILARPLEAEELKYLTVHKLGHPEKTIPIDITGKTPYYAFFIDKNRNGSADVILLYEVYLDILKYKEIGIIKHIPKDDFKYKK